ncbi:YkyA family protein [Facklamia hominis]|uniref:YkyA family protein n=1 Tax=Facklamia hominis TaxID=178214 RepID=UPI00288BF3F6|nr:YkyA family protein [Facklamia hominis]WPJ91670.1 YkyA family protein [Facklamia hominis]
MKKTKLVLILISILFLVSGCGRSIQRANRAIGLIQDHVTNIIGKISEVQNREFDLQANFEATLKQSEDLSAFLSSDTPLAENISKRQALIDEIAKSQTTLQEMVEELNSLPDKEQLPKEQVQKLIEYVKQLNQDLDTYVAQYRTNLKQETATFKALANTKTNHESFFKVFNNINQLYTENNMNLDRVIANFDPLNSLLVNLKVYLVNLTEKS